MMTKVQTNLIDFTFQESSARDIVDRLKEYGIRARYEQVSRSIAFDPYVENTYNIVIDYVHIDEFNCAKRILCLT